MLSDDTLSTRFPSDAQTGPRPARRSGSGFRRHRARGIGGVLLSATLVGSAVLSTSSATAEPKPTIAQAKAAIEKLQHQQELASEEYNETREQLTSVNVRLKAARVKLDRQQDELKKARVKMGQVAAETYRRGELSTLDLMLGDDPSAALAQAGYLPSLGQRQTGAVSRLNDVEKKLVAAEKEIEQQQAKATAAKATMTKTKATVERRLAEAQAELKKLNAAERARVLEEMRNRDNPPASSTSSSSKSSSSGGSSSSSGSSGGGSSSGGSSGGGGTTSCGGKSVTAATAAGKAAIKFACAQLGEPYVWAGDGPNQWDCSGLTMKAFAAGGVSLPHSSRMQAGYGTPVSISNMKAGDLIFFNSPISHTAIYLGDNTMVHAPNSTTVVKVASLYDTPSAAVRL